MEKGKLRQDVLYPSSAESIGFILVDMHAPLQFLPPNAKVMRSLGAGVKTIPDKRAQALSDWP